MKTYTAANAQDQKRNQVALLQIVRDLLHSSRPFFQTHLADIGAVQAESSSADLSRMGSTGRPGERVFSQAIDHIPTMQPRPTSLVLRNRSPSPVLGKAREHPRMRRSGWEKAQQFFGAIPSLEEPII